MKVTTHSLDAQNNIENYEQLFWLAQGISNFDKEYSHDNSIIGAETLNAAFGNFITANRGLAAGKSYNSYFLFNKADCTVGSSVKNVASVKSFALHYGIIDDKNIKLTPLAEKYLLTQAISLKEYIFVILSKQWCLLDGKVERNLFSVLYEIFTDSNANKIINDDNLWQDEIFKLVTGKAKNATDSCEPRFDVLRNAVNYAGLIFKDKAGVYRIVPEAKEILKIFNRKEVSLQKYSDFYAHLASLGTGIFEVIDSTNASIINFLYPNIKPEVKIVQPSLNQPLQQIFYGAPGTGKSHTIETETNGKEVIRVTFHPDSDYSTFVGAYKPTTVEVPIRDVTGKVIKENGDVVTETRIVYKYVPQAFLKAYVKAWKNLSEPVYLVIEEINRGNCAQIFGDIFQLLDRNENGYSSYEVDPDMDITAHLKKEFDKGIDANASDKVKTGEKMLLPPNLFIWATMNTSDQSLFPIDSAFKRRWDWKYMPIDTEKENWKLEINGKTYSWSSFLKKINDDIYDLTKSEDKMLGFYFCKAEEKKISAERFVSKVLFYLYNDVYKDYGLDREFFKDKENGGKEITFQSLYNATTGKLKEARVEMLLTNLEVEDYVEDSTQDDNGDVDADDSSIKKHLRVSYLNDKGEVIETVEEKKSSETFLEVISRIDPEKIAALNLKIGDFDLMTKGRLQDNRGGYANSQREVSNGYFVVTKMDNNMKIKRLEAIANAIGLKIKAELVNY